MPSASPPTRRPARAGSPMRSVGVSTEPPAKAAELDRSTGSIRKLRPVEWSSRVPSPPNSPMRSAQRWRGVRMRSRGPTFMPFRRSTGSTSPSPRSSSPVPPASPNPSAPGRCPSRSWSPNDAPLTPSPRVATDAVSTAADVRATRWESTRAPPSRRRITARGRAGRRMPWRPPCGQRRTRRATATERRRRAGSRRRPRPGPDGRCAGLIRGPRP